MYIVIEGQDGTGKDTQARKLKEYYEKQGKKVVAYAESGTASEDPFVSKIAKLNYGSKQDIDHRTRVLLYLVNRYEQWRKLAEPALKRGDIVITTRCWFSTLVYEGYGGGVSRSLITKVHKLVMPEVYFNPDKIILLTLNEKEQAKRLGTQTDKNWNRKEEVWKSKGNEFQQKINAAYLKIAKEYNVNTVDASGTIDEVFDKILQELTRKPQQRRASRRSRKHLFNSLRTASYTAQHKIPQLPVIFGDSPAPQSFRLSSLVSDLHSESSTDGAQSQTTSGLPSSSPANLESSVQS